jgi:hypothetical protein
MGGACSTYGGKEKFIKGFMEKPEGKRPLGRPRSRGDDNNKMVFQEVEWRGGGARTGKIWLRIGTGGRQL